MSLHIRPYDEENIDDFDSDDWAEKLGLRRLDELRDKADEEAERDGRYAKDWEFRSLEYRSARDFTCEGCGVDLSNHKYLLHVHHRNMDKGNNAPSNLSALCALCHSGHHPHLRAELPVEHERVILELRKVSKAPTK